MISEAFGTGAATRAAVEDGRQLRSEPNKLQSSTKRLERRFSDGIASYPLVTAAFALAIGVTLGWLVKRR